MTNRKKWEKSRKKYYCKSEECENKWFLVQSHLTIHRRKKHGDGGVKKAIDREASKTVDSGEAVGETEHYFRFSWGYRCKVCSEGIVGNKKGRIKMLEHLINWHKIGAGD